MLVRDTPAPSDQGEDAAPVKNGPDLRDMFGDDLTSEIDCFDEEDTLETIAPITPDDSGQIAVDLGCEVGLEPEELEVGAAVMRTEIVANGWWQKWGHGGKDREGRHQACISHPKHIRLQWSDVDDFFVTATGAT